MNSLKINAVYTLVALAIAAGVMFVIGLDTPSILFTGALVFLSVMLVLVMFRQGRLQSRLHRMEYGLHEYESRINAKVKKSYQRSNELSLSPTGMIMHGTKPATDLAQLSDKVQAAAPAKPHLVGEEEKNTVVPFLRVVTDADGVEPETPDVPEDKLGFQKNSLHIRLQPLINISQRETSGFYMVPGFDGPDGDFLTFTNMRHKLKGHMSLERCDLAIMEKAFSVLRSFDELDPDLKFVLPIGGAALQGKKAFKEFLHLVQMHDRFSKQLMIALEPESFEALKKSALSRMVEVNDCGFEFILSDCGNPSETLTAVHQNAVAGLSFCMHKLEQADMKLPDQDIFAQLQDVVDANLFVMITNVTQENQIMKMIDYSIDVATGEYFSEPKLPRIRSEASEPAKA
jgi:EAL domain-containing protein (putative c-di-GMP-specific phosphodiesterase class I)